MSTPNGIGGFSNSFARRAAPERVDRVRGGSELLRHATDEYEFVVHPRLAGHGPTLFAGLSKWVDLKLVSRLELGSGAVVMRYEPGR